MTLYLLGVLRCIDETCSKRFNKNDPHFIVPFGKCIDNVKNWCINIRKTEIQKIIKTAPYIDHIYESTYKVFFKEFVDSKFKKQPINTETIRIVSFDEFFTLFLKKSCSTPHILSPPHTLAEFTFIIMGILRSVFSECIHYVTCSDEFVANLSFKPPKSIAPSSPGCSMVEDLTEENLRVHDN
jgi:hypothetical protein